MKRWQPPLALLWTWAALLILLGFTVTFAYQPLGSLNTPVALVIAMLKALLVAAVFMELRKGRPLMLAFATAGFLWLTILLWLGSTDFITRPGFPYR
jgi:cytochrome c oxidase subunit IV